MVTDNIIKCSKADREGLDREIVKEAEMLMKLIKMKSKNEKGTKNQLKKKELREKEKKKIY